MPAIPMLPNFLIAGVARCGTTSLYHYMKQHPDIAFSALKEPKYFSSIHLQLPHNGIGDHTVDRIIINDFEKYISLFSNLERFRMVGEASSDYLYFHNVTVDAIKDTLGDIPVIISIRNPVERAYSAYNNLVRDGRESLNFLDALHKEELRIKNNWDWMWAYKGGGLYADAIAHFQSAFSQVKVVLLEDLVDTPDRVLQEIFTFLSVDANIAIQTGTKYSHSGKPRNRFISVLTDRNNKIAYVLRRAVMASIPRSAIELAASKALIKDPIPQVARHYLQDYFQADIDKLEPLIQKKLDHWLQA